MHPFQVRKLFFLPKCVLSPAVGDHQEFHQDLWHPKTRILALSRGIGSVVTRWLRGGSAVGHWTCNLQVAGSIPAGPLSRNIGQLSFASLRGR